MKRLIRHIIKYFFIISNNRIKYARYLGVKIGTNCRIYIDDWGTEPDLISIGNNVTITKDVMLLTHDGSYILYRDKSNNRLYSFANIDIGNNIFIGVKSIIMPGVSICDNVIIGAGSIVTKSIIKSGVYVGTPAKYIKPFGINEKS
jgi:acetyltransferase-like isoleucine patch superfamily enzyme